MPASDVYTFRSGAVTLSTTSITAAMSVFGVSTKRGWCVGVGVSVGLTTAAAGNNLLFQLARPANTPVGTSLASAGGANDYSAPASLCQSCTTWTTAPTLGAVLWEKELSQASGTAWTEFPPVDDAWGIPAIASGSANAGIHMFVTASVSTSTPVYVTLTVSE